MKMTTKRLQLTPVTDEDFDVLFQIFTNAYVRKYLCDGEIFNGKKIRDFLETSKKNFALHFYGLWLLKHTESNNVIGFAGLWSFFDEPQPQLLYALLPQYTGQGFATEASIAIIHYSFQQLGFSYLVASCDTPNVSSHKVVQRLGMVKFKEEIHNGNPVTFYFLEKDLFKKFLPSPISAGL
jgi:[ribosomal protein S5]-alanine N-acetyltransferase